MGFSRQEYWSGLPFPSPGNLPDQEIKPQSSVLQADSLPSEPPGKLVYVKQNLLYRNQCTLKTVYFHLGVCVKI